jgi:mRNA interferase HigB
LYPYWEQGYTAGVRIIARSTLTRFVESLAGQREQRAVKAALDAWFHEVENADWTSSAEVKKSYANASIVGAERVVFNIKGNDYRMITAVDYKRKIVFIKWLGTHAAYDKIDARTVQYAD